jgi:hypothetical protein
VRKWQWISYTLEEWGWIHWKTSIWLESTGSQKERKTEANLEKECLGSRKMWQNIEWR